VRCAGITPHAPCTTTCIRNDPRQSHAAVDEKANRGTIGSPSTAQNAIVRRRPNRSDRAPKNSPPMIAPMLQMTAMTSAVDSESPAPPWSVALRKVG
jgi:hypothetical protein